MRFPFYESGTHLCYFNFGTCVLLYWVICDVCISIIRHSKLIFSSKPVGVVLGNSWIYTKYNYKCFKLKCMWVSWIKRFPLLQLLKSKWTPAKSNWRFHVTILKISILKPYNTRDIMDTCVSYCFENNVNVILVPNTMPYKYMKSTHQNLLISSVGA